MLNPDHWKTINGLVAWIDGENGRSDHEIAMRIMKVTEEAGEVAAAYIGMTGQNPRKGVTHSRADVQDELCDVILAASVALASLTGNPHGVLDAKLAKVAKRAAEDDIVAYRNSDRPGVLLCREHGAGWMGLTPLGSDDLPDGGICTWQDCGADVLIAAAR